MFDTQQAIEPCRYALVGSTALAATTATSATYHHYYHQQNAGTMMLKTWHKAIAKFAMVRNNNAGASAIFKLFTARPQLLEKRLKRPPPTAVAAAVAEIVSQERKRGRL